MKKLGVSYKIMQFRKTVVLHKNSLPGIPRIPFNFLDVDECADGPTGCNGNSECINNVGGYTCKCKAGYSGDGMTCKGNNSSFVHTNLRAVQV